MNKIYLVINTQEDNYIINICTSVKVAETLAEVYKNNFIKNGDYKPEEVDFIEVKPLELRDDVNILWDVYSDDIEAGFTYAQE